jgi:hypothetical protein
VTDAVPPEGGFGPGRDTAAVYDLSLRYAAAADGRDSVGFAELFEPDGELVVPNYPDDPRSMVVCRGRDRLRAAPQALRRYVHTMHVVSNAILRLDGDAGTGSVVCVAHHVEASPEPIDTVWYIRYDDRYRRIDGSWRFAQRILRLQWIEVHPVHLVVPPSEG